MYSYNILLITDYYSYRHNNNITRSEQVNMDDDYNLQNNAFI